MPIDKLTRVQTVSNADLVPLFSATGGDDQAATMATVAAHIKAETFAVAVPVNVSGSRASGAALVSLLAALSAAGIITNNTTT